VKGEEAAASGHKARGISLTSRPAAAGRSSGAPTRGQRRAERRRVPTEASPPDVGRRQAAGDRRRQTAGCAPRCVAPSRTHQALGQACYCSEVISSN